MNRSIYLSQKKPIKNLAADAIIKLHQDGYSHDFSIWDAHNFLCFQNNKLYTQDEVTTTFIDEFYDRFTCNYKFIYAIETCCGMKGVMLTDKMYVNGAIKQNDGLPASQILRNRLDPITYNMIIELFDKKSRGEERLLVRFKDKILPIAFDDVAFFYLENELTQLVMFDGKSYIIQKTLEELEKQGGLSFFRANRQYLINKRAIKDLSTSLTRSMTVNLKFAFPSRIDVSKNKAGNFLDWLSLNP